MPIISTLQGFNEEKLCVDRESRVRSYCGSANAIFDTASASFMRDVDGGEYIDFPSSTCSLKLRSRRLPDDCCWQAPQDSCWPRCAQDRIRRCSPGGKAGGTKAGGQKSG